MSSEVRQRKILVIGSSPHSREITAVEWYAYGLPTLNIADYDVVIVNVSGVSLDYSHLVARTIPVRACFAKLLESKGELFIISDPAAANYWWSPTQFDFVKEAGDTIEVQGENAGRLARYLSNVKSWTFCLRQNVDASWVSDYYIVESGHEDIEVTPNFSIIAQNRYGRMLAAVISLSISELIPAERLRDEASKQHLLDWGPITILPPPTECSVREGIDILLADRFAIRQEREPPLWVNQHKVAGQAEAEKKVQEIKARIAAKKENLEQAQKQLQHIVQFRQLLYEQGEPLQEIVWATLEELDAVVTRPTVKNEEDGWIKVSLADQTLEGVLEITGRSKSVTLDDARQLDNWVANGLDKGDKYKGLLIGNHYIEQHPQIRPDAFPANLIDYGTTRDFCLLTTVDLFNAYCAFKEGKLARDDFWRKIFNTIGPCQIL